MAKHGDFSVKSIAPSPCITSKGCSFEKWNSFFFIQVTLTSFFAKYSSCLLSSGIIPAFFALFQVTSHLFCLYPRFSTVDNSKACMLCTFCCRHKSSFLFIAAPVFWMSFWPSYIFSHFHQCDLYLCLFTLIHVVFHFFNCIPLNMGIKCLHSRYIPYIVLHIQLYFFACHTESSRY